MINDFISGKILILVFIGICAYQDMKHKSIDMRICVLMCLAEFIWYMYMLASGGEVRWLDICAGISIGFLLLVLARKTDILGEGDAMYFIITGAAVGWHNNLKLFILTMLIISLACLALIVKNFFKNKSSRKSTIAMLLFSFPAGIFVLFS